MSKTATFDCGVIYLGESTSTLEKKVRAVRPLWCKLDLIKHYEFTITRNSDFFPRYLLPKD